MEYNFPMYTIGEAATATIVEFSDQDWEFNFISRPKYAHLCTIPVEGYEIFLPPNEKIGLNGPGRFVSFGKDLLDAATPFLANLIQESYNRNYEQVKLFIPHAPSKAVYLDNLVKMGIDREKVLTEVFERYGNIVSSSVPAGICRAVNKGKIKTGDEISLTPASAGLSAAVVKLNY